jgi:GNAT superfamily N-acetyltransferase
VAERVREAQVSDAAAIGRLLDAFTREYDDFTPGPDALAERIAVLLWSGEVTVLLAGEPPCAVSVLRFRPSLWTEHLECHLAELYVTPERPGQGLGRALLQAAIDHARARGADFMDLGTSADDRVARRRNESFGFTNLERPGGPVMYLYERER